MKNERNNFCKNLKKWQSEENAKLKENCHKKKFFLTKSLKVLPNKVFRFIQQTLLIHFEQPPEKQ